MYIFSAFVILAGSVCSNSFVSNAAFFEYTMKCAEPAKTDNNGYIVLLMHDSSNGSYFPHIYAWNAYSASGDENGDSTLYNAVTEYVFVGSSFIEFGPSCLYGEYTLVAHSIYEIDEESIFRMKLSSKSERFRMDYGETITCVDYKIYGNGYVDYDGVGGVGDWNVYFDDSEECRILRDIYTLLLNMTDDSSLGDISSVLTKLSNKVNEIGYYVTSMDEKLSSIDYSLDYFRSGLFNKLDSLGIDVADIKDILDTIDDKLDAIGARLAAMYEEQQKQTSWLEKIWDSIQELLGLEGDHTEEDTQVDGSEIEDLGEAEEHLLKDTEEYESSLEITIGNAFGTITDLVTRFVNIHPDIFSFFITMLTLGTVALILGR